MESVTDTLKSTLAPLHDRLPDTLKYALTLGGWLVGAALGATAALTAAYVLSQPLAAPPYGPQGTAAQLWQKALVALLVLLIAAGFFTWRYGLFAEAGPLKYIGGGAAFLTLLLVTVWVRSAWPIGGQEAALAAKLGALVGLFLLSLLILTGIWEFLGGKVLPHVIGVPLPEGTLFFYGPRKVLVPLLILAGSAAAVLFLAVAAWAGFQDANLYWITRPSSWLLPSPVAILSGFLLLAIAGTWGRYAALVGSLRQERQALLEPGAFKHGGDPAARSRHVRLAEYFLGTREWNLLTFHRLPDDPHGLGYAFPGFLVGLEKAGRNLIGVPPHEEDAAGPLLADQARRHGSTRLLNDRKRTFISHIVEFQPGGGADSADCRRPEAGLGPRFHFNLYGHPDDPLACRKARATGWGEPSKAYGAGFEALDHLGESLRRRALEAPADKAYTHVLVLCMGWNTDQQEAIRNYNSIVGYLKEARALSDPLRPFEPLVIGLSWPSQWAGFLPASYPAKADDADETGMVWGAYLLHRVIGPLKRDLAGAGRPVKVALVGHSFGTRVLTRAMASDPAWIGRGGPKEADSSKRIGAEAIEAGPIGSGAMGAGEERPLVDLFVGLQGAFSIDRFVDRGVLTGGGQENAPYRDLVKSGTRFVFTWSKEDKANPLAAYVTAANHIGGTYGADLACDRPETFTPVTYRGPDSRGLTQAACPDTVGDKPALRGDFGSEGWDPVFWSQSRGTVLMVNMSEVVKHTPYGKGGKAHSDIYKYQIGHFIWKSLVALDLDDAGPGMGHGYAFRGAGMGR